MARALGEYLPQTGLAQPHTTRILEHSPSTTLVNEAIDNHMYPLTLDGLDEVARVLQS